MEVETTIKELCPGKAPGLDGLTADFYIRFSDILYNILTAVFNNIYDQKQLTYSQHLVIIILLFKKGDHRMVENY